MQEGRCHLLHLSVNALYALSHADYAFEIICDGYKKEK
jgi:hypothetical protein